MIELTPEEQAKGLVRPFRDRVRHTFCDTVSKVLPDIAEQMARDPSSWSSCYCMVCGRRLPAEQFTWLVDGSAVGS